MEGHGLSTQIGPPASSLEPAYFSMAVLLGFSMAVPEERNRALKTRFSVHRTIPNASPEMMSACASFIPSMSSSVKVGSSVVPNGK
jgi:hypothetical protein